MRTDLLPPTIAILQRLPDHHSIGPKDSSNSKKGVGGNAPGVVHGASTFDMLRCKQWLTPIGNRTGARRRCGLGFFGFPNPTAVVSVSPRTRFAGT